MLRFILLLIALALPASAADDHGHDTDHHKREAAGVAIVHGWARATTSGATQVFMEIRNGRDTAITLRGGHVAGGGSATVVGAPIRAGEAPAPLGAFAIPAGMTFDLEPEGVYLALTGLDGPLAQGATLPLVLDLHPVGEVEIVVDVEAAQATQHSHAGHMH